MSRLLNAHQRMLLRQLDELPPADERRDSTEYPAASVWLVTPQTPLFCGDETGVSTGRAAEVATRLTDRSAGATDPFDEPKNREAITGISGADITVAGDQTGRLVAGSRFRIDADNDNDGWHEAVDVTYNDSGDETIITLTTALPDSTVTGDIVLPGPWPLETLDTVRSASCQTSIVGMPGDEIVIARIGDELLPIAGPVTLWGILDEALDEPEFEAGPPKKLTASSASVTVYRLDPETHEFLSTGIQITMYSIWEGLNLPSGHTVAFERYAGHWVLKPASCSPSQLV